MFFCDTVVATEIGLQKVCVPPLKMNVSFQFYLICTENYFIGHFSLMG